MRFRQRHVHQTIVNYLTEQLTSLGWVNAPINFGTDPVTIMAYQPLEAGETPAFNTVAISLGNETEDVPYELGGGVHEVRYALFVDVYGANIPIGIAIADDIKDALTEEIIGLLDFTTSADGVAVDAQIEFESVMVEVLSTATTTIDKRSWRAVKAMACLYF